MLELSFTRLALGGVVGAAVSVLALHEAPQVTGKQTETTPACMGSEAMIPLRAPRFLHAAPDG
jgi:hypothetical protein